MPKRRTYFRIRRIGAAELLRLQGQGHEVHAEAIEWAKMTIDGIDDVGGRPPAKERTEILALLAKHPDDGRTPEQVAEALGDVAVKTMQNVLYNLRKQGQCAVVKCMGRAFYFATEDAANAQRPRFERERQAVYEAARNKRAAAAKAHYEARQSDSGSSAPSAIAGTERSTTRTQREASETTCGPVEIVYPKTVLREERPTPRALIDRFGVDDPDAMIPGGFRAEWLALRAGGSEA